MSNLLDIIQILDIRTFIGHKNIGHLTMIGYSAIGYQNANTGIQNFYWT